MRKLSVRVPCSQSGGVHPMTWSFLNELPARLAEHGFEADVSLGIGGDIICQRNAILGRWWEKSDAEQLLCLDGDNWCKPRDLLPLLESDAEIACGVYPSHPKLHYGCAAGGSWFNGLQGARLEERACGEHGPQRVMRILATGFGMVRLSRAAVAKVRARFPENEHWSYLAQSKALPLFDPVYIRDERRGELVPLSEDYSFFWRAQQAGVRVEAHVDFEVGHGYETRDMEGRTFAQMLGV